MIFMELNIKNGLLLYVFHMYCRITPLLFYCLNALHFTIFVKCYTFDYSSFYFAISKYDDFSGNGIKDNRLFFMDKLWDYSQFSNPGSFTCVTNTVYKLCIDSNAVTVD